MNTIKNILYTILMGLVFLGAMLIGTQANAQMEQGYPTYKEQDRDKAYVASALVDADKVILHKEKSATKYGTSKTLYYRMRIVSKKGNYDVDVQMMYDKGVLIGAYIMRGSKDIHIYEL